MSQLLLLAGVGSIKIKAWQENEWCGCSSAGPLKIHDCSASVAVDSSVTVPSADIAMLHKVYYLKKQLSAKTHSKRLPVLLAELKQTIFIAAQEINNNK